MDKDKIKIIKRIASAQCRIFFYLFIFEKDSFKEAKHRVVVTMLESEIKLLKFEFEHFDFIRLYK